MMVLYSGRSLSQVHYTDYEEFPFQVHPRNSPCHITWRIKVTRGERRVLTRDTLRICQIRHVRNPLTRKTLYTPRIEASILEFEIGQQ